MTYRCSSVLICLLAACFIFGGCATQGTNAGGTVGSIRWSPSTHASAKKDAKAKTWVVPSNSAALYVYCMAEGTSGSNTIKAVLSKAVKPESTGRLKAADFPGERSPAILVEDGGWLANLAIAPGDFCYFYARPGKYFVTVFELDAATSLLHQKGSPFELRLGEVSFIRIGTSLEAQVVCEAQGKAEVQNCKLVQPY